ncbi:hypothetical protein JCM8547_007009 [Rhodosporidiobolus lusitaniae]
MISILHLQRIPARILHFPAAVPVPSLPLEFVSLILDALWTASGKEKTTRYSDGLLVALVCKAWRPLGLKLTFRRVVLESSAEAEAIVEHFKELPHLPSFVKEVVLCSLSAGTEEPADDEDEEVGSSAESSVEHLLSVCVVACELQVLDAPWVDVSRLLPSMERLLGLKRLKYTPDHKAEGAVDLLLSTLPALSQLSFLDLRCRHGQEPVRLPTGPATLPVRQLRLILISAAPPAPPNALFYRSVLDLVLLDTLHSCTSSRTLTNVDAVIHADPGDHKLARRLVDFGTTHKLERLALGSTHGTAIEFDHSGGSSSLDAFLRALSPSLVIFTMTDFYLTSPQPRHCSDHDPPSQVRPIALVGCDVRYDEGEIVYGSFVRLRTEHGPTWVQVEA